MQRTMKRAQPTTLVDKALALATQGLWVFPCNSKTKKPMTQNGFQDAVNDAASVRHLFEWAGEDALIAVKTGADSDILAIDFDFYKGPDAEKMFRHLEETGLLPPTKLVYTRSGGVHLLYRGNGAGYPTLAFRSEAVDVKGDGGYVIWWEAHGQDSTGDYAEAPSALINYLNNYRRSASAESVTELKRQIRDAENFHDCLTRLAARLSAQGHTADEVMAELLECMRSSIASNPEHPRHSRWQKLMANDEKEISRIVNSSEEKYSSKAASTNFAENVDLEKLREVAAKAGFRNATPGGADNEPTVVPVDGFVGWPFEDQGYFAHHDHDLLSQRFVMHPLLCEDESILISAEPKAGKTAIALTCGLHIATGIDLGPSLRVAEPRGVLYFGLEGRRAIRLRIAAWRRKMVELGHDLPEQIPLFVIERSKNLLHEAERQTLANAIAASDIFLQEKYGVSLGAIFIDTYTKAMPGGDQNSVEDTSAVFDVVSRVRENGCTASVAFIHHKSRSGNVRGSTNIEADPDVLTSVSREGNKVVWTLDRARSVEEGAAYHFRLHNYALGVSNQGFSINAPYVEPVDAETPSNETTTAAKRANSAMACIVNMGEGEHDLATIYAALDLEGLAPPLKTRRAKRIDPKSKEMQDFFMELVPERGYVFAGKAVERVLEGGVLAAIRVGL